MVQFSKRQKIWFGLSAAALALFIVWTLIVKFVDVDQVGLSHLNQFFWQHCGSNKAWELITKLMGYLCFLVLAGLVVCQIVQWVCRKSLWRVDKNLLAFDAIAVVFLVVYIFFEIVVINYRPVLIDGVEKASYPSTHAMLFVTVLPILIAQVWHYLKSKPWRIVLTVVLSLFMVIGVVGRLFSGMHWFTDIVAGIIIASSMVCFYFSLVAKQSNNKY